MVLTYRFWHALILNWILIFIFLHLDTSIYYISTSIVQYP